MKIQPAERVRGTIQLPGDKSISHRAAILAAMAEGETRIENFATAADCASTLQCLKDLGVEIRREERTVFVKGVGKTGFRKPEKELDCGNSGTTMRLLAGVLAGQNFDSVLIGDESLMKRPMRRIVEPLEMMGARIESENGCAPLRIRGKNPLESIIYSLPFASAQVKSCILIAGLNAAGKTSVESPASKKRAASSRNHTELMLEFLGANVEEDFTEFEGGFKHIASVEGNSKLVAGDLRVPADISSAAFFAVAAACLPNSEICLQAVGVNQTRAAFLEVLQNFGVQIEILNQTKIANELVGDLLVRGSEHLSSLENTISEDLIANLIDEIPILAVFGTQCENGLEVRGAGELRVKESDRIAAVVENLRRMQASVEEFSDGFRVEKSRLKGARVDAFGDHRIAMAFSIAALFADGEMEIEGAECARISFPEFFQVLQEVVK